MKISFKDCLEKKKIFRFHPAKHLVDLEIKDSQDDLASAKDEFEDSGFKWATIKGYYSMYHAARALLYSKGYREKSHICLYVAMKKLFVEEGALDPKFAEDLYNCMVLREDADYHHKFSQEGSKAAIESAERFLHMAQKLLKMPRLA